MTDEVVKKGTNIFDELLKSEPKLSVLSDNPVSLADMRDDVFDLGYHLGPVYDLIRTPDTQMPLTIGINGKWGTGKSTAMKWLREMLDEWNKLPESKGKIRTRNIWFCPWKYHNKEDLWKGLIAEVILNATDFSKATPKTVLKAVKLLCSFVGKSALDVLSASEYEVAGFKISGKTAKEIKKNFKQANHPEKPFLNEYEDGLKVWVRETLSEKKERMVIFIDDLDRCMPDIALQMLESLKLYLNIDKLIFIIGMDRVVVETAVKAYYADKKIEGIKPDDYLDKMLQLELSLSPQKKQMDIYLDDLLDKVNYKRNIVGYTTKSRERFYQLFRKLISKHGGRNPRLIKRLINSSLIRGCGAEKITNISNNNPPTFEQGVQIFFIQTILAKTYNLTDLVGDGGRGDKFFEMWSEIVWNNATNKEFRGYFPELLGPPDLFQDNDIDKDDDITAENKLMVSPVNDGRNIPKYLPKQYHELYIHLINSNLPVTLLANEDLSELMQIKYSMTIAEKAKDQDIEINEQDDATKIQNVLAEHIMKAPNKIEEDDLKLSGPLILSDKQISDISSLSNLKNIKCLSLHRNKIRDITPLRNLEDIRILTLHHNKINDISPLMNMKNITALYLDDNQIRDISPLKNLKDIVELSLSMNQINDISPLMDMKDIEKLNLDRNQISDIFTLANLIYITELHLRYNRIIDISALANLIYITELNLNDNQISDISPLVNLKNIQKLDLRANQISDISPLMNLKDLIRLYLSDNPISDISPIFGLKKLEHLEIRLCKSITNKKVEELFKEIPKLMIYR